MTDDTDTSERESLKILTREQIVKAVASRLSNLDKSRKNDDGSVKCSWVLTLEEQALRDYLRMHEEFECAMSALQTISTQMEDVPYDDDYGLSGLAQQTLEKIRKGEF